jgi:hypothetical protein
MFDHPLEQSANNPDQVIETSRSCTCSAQEECVDGSWGNLGKGHDPRGVQIAIEHSQHLVLDIVPPVQGSLVADKSDDMWCDRARWIGKPGLHCSSSPSPRATSRSASTWTFA